MKKIAILVEQQNEDIELLYPYYRLLEEGYEVDLIGSDKNTSYKGKVGYTMISDYSSGEAKAEEYDAVIIPGGFSPDFMRRNNNTKNFVREMDKRNKIIAAICHGPWMMASSCDIKGKDITGFFSIEDDLVNAGANYVDKEVVVEGNLITSRTPKDLPIFMKTIIAELEK